MKHLPTAFALLGLVVTGACGGGSPTPRAGNIEVSWKIGGSSCTEVNVQTVRVSVLGQDAVFDTMTAPCQTGVLRMPNIDPGVYTIQVDGFPSESAVFATYSGTIENVNVAPGAVIPAHVSMSQKRGAIDLSWQFKDGKLCGFEGVAGIDVFVWNNLQEEVFSGKFPCDPVQAKGVSEAKEPATQLWDNAHGVVVDKLPAGSYKVRAFGAGANKPDYLFWGESPASIDFGRLTAVNIMLDSCKTTGAVICQP